MSDDTYSGSGLSHEIISNTYAQVPHGDSLDVNDSMTVAFWMRADNDVQSADWYRPIAKSVGEPPLGREFQRFIANSRVDTTEGENANDWLVGWAASWSLVLSSATFFEQTMAIA